MEPNDQKTALVIMEAGARWPSYARELAGRASSAVVESQQVSESLGEFSERVTGRLRRLAERQIRVPVAILATNQRIDREAEVARYQMARQVVGLLAEHGGGELLVMGGEHFADEVRHALMAFAGALCDGLHGSSVNVRLRFGADQSGTRRLGPLPRIARSSSS